MENLRPHYTAADTLERYHAETYESNTAWTRDMTLLAISMTPYDSKRVYNLAALAIRSQSEVVRTAILETYAIPFPIREAVEATEFTAVEPLPVQTFEETLGLSDSTVREIMRRRVNEERDNRINGTFEFEGATYQSRPEDRENMAGAAISALAAMTNGAQVGDLRWHGEETDFVWIAEDNTQVPMDAQTMFALGQEAMAHKQAHIFAARALKDAATIPEDYAADIHWPGYVAPVENSEQP